MASASAEGTRAQRLGRKPWALPFRSFGAVMILLVGPAPAFQAPKREPAPKPSLTAEEREILKNRELLENLDLLQDFDKFRYFDYFAAEEAADKPKEIQKPAAKKEIKKEEKKKK